MPQDAFTIKYVVKELSGLLTGGKISKITQYGKDSLTFIIYTSSGTVKLDMCFSARDARISLTDADRPAPAQAPAFCMLLRKRLQNAQITYVRQIPSERIAVFGFLCTSEFEREELTLYAELMGKYSNAVLVKDGVIAGALKTTAIGETTRRVLLTGAPYVLPAPQEKTDPEDLPALKKLFETACGDAADFIAANVKGIAYVTAADIAETFGGEVTAERLYGYVTDGKTDPCVVAEGGVYTDFKAKYSGAGRISFPTLLEAQKAYYDRILADRSFSDAVKKLGSALRSALKKQEKRLQLSLDKLIECRDAESARLKGELLTANIYAVPRGADSFEAVNYYDPEQGAVKIALDKTLSPSQNAQKYFRRYAKLKRTRETAEAMKGETEGRIAYLNSIEAHLNAAENFADLEEIAEELKEAHLLRDEGKKRAKKAQPVPFRTFSVDGFTIYAGRNNIQNDRLLKSVSPNDIWLHTQGYHSSHTVIASGGKSVPDRVLQAAAEICAYYSDGRGGAKIPVDYTERKHVKKPPASPAGFVTYTDYKTALVDPHDHKEERTDR